MARNQGVRVVLAGLLSLSLAATVIAQGQTTGKAPAAGTAVATVAAKTAAPGKADPSKAPARAGARPDLQGVWDFAQLTPFERPDEFGNKSTLTDEDAEEFAQTKIERDNKDNRSGTAEADLGRAYNDFWWDFGTRVAKQPSLVVDPADGRMPPLTPAAQERVANRKTLYDNPEERPLAERCILGFNSGPPMVPSAYNNNVQIVQTKDQILIFNEMVHSARVIDMSGRPHPPSNIRSLAGHSTGRWEGNTLVVDTTNYAREGNFRISSKDLHLIERFTLDGKDVLRYDFTVDDPTVWTKKFTASIPMHRSEELMFEYACHESNYGMEGVMRGARFQDKMPTAR
jgi:hypothetical protein